MLLGAYKGHQEFEPLIARLNNVQNRFHELDGNHEEVLRQELADVLLDLGDKASVNSRQYEIIADILLTLVRQATRDLCLALSERLAVLPTAPLRVVLHLANQDIDIAKPVLAHSRTLTDYDLMCLIQAHGPSHWQAIAERTQLGADVVTILAEKKDPGTAHILLKNADICIPEAAFHVMGSMAETNAELQRPLIERSDIPASVVQKIYTIAAETIKHEIEERFTEQPEVIAALRGVTREIQHSAENQHPVTIDMLSFATAAKSKGILTMPFMIGTLKRGQIASFKAQLKVLSQLPLETVERILAQNHGQGLAILCRALQINRTDFIQIYTLTQKLRSKDGHIIPQSMAMAIAYFDRMNTPLAQRILKNSQL